ncbi:YitT family protein [Hymenobacter sp. BT683]|uniref:YitT family protein n=1 Tax=Hymenobacter jeongseonensis TaxID=2791027 RepID=A0ABS0IKV0_9BACT|nr:YitT family protein [Hymenobacter jeongseonensis]MBF9238493.1 YitT family protein [Hymenobacter jeongseonensis]
MEHSLQANAPGPPPGQNATTLPGALGPATGLPLRRYFVQFAFMAMGVLSAALGLKGFLLPNGFIDGGVTGISLLGNQLSGVSVSVLIVLLNLPFIVMGYYQLGRTFALKTLVAIVALAGALLVISFPTLTNDKLLIAVFGGFFLGAGIGLTVRGGAVLDGTEVLALYLSKKTALSVGDVILLINLVIFGAAAILLSVETALYSILAYLSAAKTIDFIIEGIEEYTGVTIISAQSEAIRTMLTEKLGRGATIYAGRRGFGSHGHAREAIDIIFTVTTRLEVTRLKEEIDQIDPQAFVVMHSVRETKGGLVKRRPLH